MSCDFCKKEYYVKSHLKGLCPNCVNPKKASLQKVIKETLELTPTAL